MNTIRPCPFCGEVPERPDGLGTQCELICDCGMAMSTVQVSDLMTMEERRDADFDMAELSYPKEFVDRAILHVITQWNRRSGGSKDYNI